MINQISVRVNANNQIILTQGNFRKRNQPTYNPPTVTGDTDRLLCAVSERKQRSERSFGRLAMHKEIHSNSEYLQKRRSDTALGIIKKSQRKPKTCRLNKPKSFTSTSGQKLRECGSAIDKICGDPRFSHCVTLTLPANHFDAYVALASQTSYIINRLFQPIRRFYGEMCLWFFVWEYQKRGALHLHIAIHHPDESEGLYISQKIIDQWHKILCDVGEITRTDMFCKADKKSSVIRSKHQHHAQPMRKSLGAYFSKYAGKKESKQEWYCRRFPVSRFWGSSRSVKDIVKSLSFSQSWEYTKEESLERVREIIWEIISMSDCNLQSIYAFDISKTYADGNKLPLAQGERMVFYCAPSNFAEILSQFRAMEDEF